MLNWGIEYINAITPLGLDIAQTYRSTATGLQRFSETYSYYSEADDHLDAQREPQVVSAITWLDPDNSPQEKFAVLLPELLQRWVLDCSIQAVDLTQTTIVWVLPEVLAFSPALFEGAWRKSGMPLYAAMHVLHGNCGMIQALLLAQDQEASPNQRMLIIGFECFLDPVRLAGLDQAWRLKTSRNPAGFVPSEAISLIALGSKGSAWAAAAQAHETDSFDSEHNSSGIALAQVICQCLPNEDTTIWCDLNGETYRFHEWGTAWARIGLEWPHAFQEIHHPFDGLGNCGAASGGILIGLALESIKNNGDAHCVVFTGSDNGKRTAIRLEKGALSCLPPPMSIS
ncbi:MAG: hypothetical protein H6510_12015 [Acidobacteria bacterium]|nr:hypothetical protein [Acidobacteriota bacterium]